MTTRNLPLGATCMPDGVRFRVFSSVAERVQLCLFEPSGGLRCDPSKLLVDPYAKAVSRQRAWGQPAPRAFVVDDTFEPYACFAPHAEYASTDRGGQVCEFKAMVKALHEAGLEVVIECRCHAGPAESWTLGGERTVVLMAGEGAAG